MRTIRNCNVAVIGGAGFLGSHLVDHLFDDRGCRVLVLDNLCVGRLEFVNRKADFEHCDITKSESHLYNLFKTYGVRAVFNYAAWPYIPDSFQRPLHVFEVNATGAIMAINAAQEAGVEAFLQVSSAEIYGSAGLAIQVRNDWGGGSHASRLDTTGVKISENAPVTPHSTYGVAKAAVDSYVQCAWRERKTPAIALRQFNCVGERETHPYVVPEIISQLAKAQDVQEEANVIASIVKQAGRPVIKLGNNSFRDFLYAGDQARIAVELLERGQFGEVYNLGSETGIKMYDLARLIGKLMGFADVTVEHDPARVRPWEIWHLQSDNSKLNAALHLNFKSIYPTITALDEALKKTIAWFNSNGRKWPWEK